MDFYSNTSSAFDGAALEEACLELAGGAPRMSAFLDAIHQADQEKDVIWQLLFRYDYAFEATFHDDPPKAMPIAAEFSSIYEQHLECLGEEGPEMYLMITQMAIEPVIGLPQISKKQWEDLMEHFYQLVKRYHVGLRTYWWQMANFYRFIDPEKAYSYFEKFWKTGRDGLSDCRACERSNAVRLCLLVGNRTAADEYAKPLVQQRIRFCADTPQLMWLAYLEDALDHGNLEEAGPRARSLYRKGNRDRSDLSYLGAVLRCFAFTEPDRALEVLEQYLPWTVYMWDQKKVYDFYKGAWICCERQKKLTSWLSLTLPDTIPVSKETDGYDPFVLAQWFYTQAKEIASRFDQRNTSDFFQRDLETAGQWL